MKKLAMTCALLFLMVAPACPAVCSEKSPRGLDVQLGEEALAGASSYEQFVADTSEYQCSIVFSAKEELKNFSVLALTLEDIDSNGKATFSEKKLHVIKRLAPRHPFLLKMTFMGTIPNYGVSYVDQKGRLRRFTVEQSGMDGSVFLAPF